MGIKVLIVGLPYFSKELAKNLQKKYPNDTFISLDTYYTKKDQLKFIYHIFSADIVHSINGTLGKSKVLEMAMKLRKRIIFHWVGTDLIKSTELYQKNEYNPKFISYPTHITDSPWYVDKLKNIGIKSEFIPLKGFDSKYKVSNFKSEFNVLCYISQHRAKYYGIEQVTEIANRLPNIKFNLVGIESYDKQLPQNIILNGWVDNMLEWIENATICLRLPKTDGLSFFVLESLAMQRYVAYNQKFKFSDYCVSVEDFVDYITEKKAKFDNNKLKLNSKASSQVLQEFNSERVLSSIYNIYTNSLKNKLNQYEK